MTLQDIQKLLETTGMPVAYEHFPEEKAPTMPFICWTEISPNNFAADGVVFYSGKMIEAQLFTKKKDIKSEELVEIALAPFYWTKDSEWDEDEQCYRVIYLFAM